MTKPSIVSSNTVYKNESAGASPLAAGNFTIAAGTNTALVVWIAHERTGTERSITGVTYNSVSMTEVAEILTSTGSSTRESLACYVLVTPATGSNAIEVTYSGGSGNDMMVFAQQWDDVNQSTPTGTTDTVELLNATGGSGAEVSITTDADSILLFGGVRNDNANGTATISVSVGTLDIADRVPTSPDYGVGFWAALGYNTGTGALTEKMTYDSDGSDPDTVAIGVELNGAVAGGATTPYYYQRMMSR